MNDVILANQNPIHEIPLNNRKIVKVRPSGVRSKTSRYPTAVKVMTVMYSASESGCPSIQTYPSVPSTLSNARTASVQRNRGSNADIARVGDNWLGLRESNRRIGRARPARKLGNTRPFGHFVP